MERLCSVSSQSYLMSLKDKHGFECMKKIGIVLNQQHVGHTFAPKTEKAATDPRCRKGMGSTPGLCSWLSPLLYPVLSRTSR
jgi:hypothetical protein